MNMNDVRAAVSQSSNPQQAVMNLFQANMGSTPMGKTILSLAQGGQGQQLETIARNMCSQRGLDFDTEFQAFRSSLGL